MVKLFVVGIPRDMNEIELLEIFTLHGQVEQVKVITDIDTGESKGYAFVNMTDQPGADRAIAALDGAEIDDRQISVRIANDKRENANPASQFASPFTPFQKTQRQPDGVRKKRPRK